MRRREPLDIDRTWQHSVPVPMPNRPVCVTEEEAIAQLARLPHPPRMFLWTDAERRCLPEKEQVMMSLYYTDNLNLKEIGLVLNVSESRVSQIHGQAVARIKSKLRDWV